MNRFENRCNFLKIYFKIHVNTQFRKIQNQHTIFSHFFQIHIWFFVHLMLFIWFGAMLNRTGRNVSWYEMLVKRHTNTIDAQTQPSTRLSWCRWFKCLHFMCVLVYVCVSVCYSFDSSLASLMRALAAASVDISFEQPIRISVGAAAQR